MHSVTTPDLFSYQKTGVDWLCRPKPNAGRHNLNALLMDEQGLGKTVQAIRAADQLGARKIAVLCRGIARDNWAREFRFWQTKQRTTSVIAGSASPELADVTICAYPTLQQRPVLTALLKANWDILIMDQCEALKNPDSLTTKLVYGADYTGKKYGLASRSAIVWPQSGSPYQNGLHEMWTHARALFPSATTNLERYDDWMDRFCYWRETTYGKRVMNAINTDEFVERLYPYILRRTQKEVLPDLPTLTWGHVVVSPDKVPQLPVELVEANTVLQAALARVKATPSEMEAQSILAATSMHIASLLKWTGVAKAKAVAESIRADLDSGIKKMVLFARHKEVFKILESEIPESVSITGNTPREKRQYYIDGFMGRVPGFNPRCINCSMDIASTSLTLTAAHHVGVVEGGWVPFPILEAVKRCHRIGQTEKVLARIYSLAGSVDEEVNEVLVRKYLTSTKVDSQFERLSAA